MNDLTKLVVLGLAAWQVVETWHHGSIFARPRAFFRLWLHSPRPVFAWAGTLINCMFCFGHWIGLLVVTSLFVFGESQAVQVVVWSFAVIRFAQLGNDLTHAWHRTPPGDVVVEHDDLNFTDPPGDVTPGS